MPEKTVKIVKIGTRGSKLSVTQAGSVIKMLQNAAPEFAFELITIKTAGDVDQGTSMTAMGGQGVFVKELEAALSRGEIDLAVHSAKDLPSNMLKGFVLAAVPERAPAEDALISSQGWGLKDLPIGAKLATGSPRRRALVKTFRPDIQLVDIRGNVDTRLRKLRDGEFEAIILARAGLIRLGLDDHIAEVLPPEDFTPAPGQGALVLEARAGDGEIIEIASRVDSHRDHACLRAERSLLAALQAGCSIPVGGWARWNRDSLRMDAVVLDTDGRTALRSSGKVSSAEEAEELGKTLAQDLIARGARELFSHGNEG